MTLTSILDDLEGQHVEMLELLADAPPDFVPETREGWMTEQVEERYSAPEVAAACIGTLVARGLARTWGTFGGGDRYSLTTLGLTLLNVFRAAARTGTP